MFQFLIGEVVSDYMEPIMLQVFQFGWLPAISIIGG